MKRQLPIILIVMLVALIGLTSLPGCDELVTNETFYHDTVTLTDSTCIFYCHTDENSVLQLAKKRWTNSAHAFGSRMDTTIIDLRSIDCGPKCHTREGFVQSLTQPTVNLTEYPTGIGCFSCHAPHELLRTAGIFGSMDSVRYNGAVTLADNSLYDNSNSNLCAYCHRSLDDYSGLVQNNAVIDPLVYDGWDSLTLHGMGETELLMGAGGFEFDSVSFAWGATVNSHKTVANQSCLSCHYEYSERYDLGGHSFNIVSGSDALTEVCNIAACHGSDPLTAQSISAKQQFITDRLYDLKSELSKAGYFDLLTGLPDTSILIPDSNMAGAIYNYLYISNDKSRGMHNYVYDTLLLRTSIDYVRGTLPPPK